MLAKQGDLGGKGRDQSKSLKKQVTDKRPDRQSKRNVPLSVEGIKSTILTYIFINKSKIICTCSCCFHNLLQKMYNDIFSKSAIRGFDHVT